MNKKYLLFLGLFGIALISAAILSYSVTRDVTVNPSFTFTGDSLGEVSSTGGETSPSEKMSLDSDTSVLIPLDIITTHEPNDVGITHVERYILSASGTVGTDSGVYINAEDTTVSTLDDLLTISWDVNVKTGYISHVDVLIDTTGDGIKDDALVFEYAKVKAPYDNSGSYPTGEVNTFGDKGTINGESYAWLTTENAGPVGGAGYTAYTLTNWKLGQTSNKNSKVIPADVTVIGFDIEIDNWIEDSDSDVSNILINGNPVEISLKSTDTLDFKVDTTFGLLNNGIYTVETEVTVR